MNKTDPHHTLLRLPQNLVAQPLGIHMPCPDPEPRPLVHLVHQRTRLQPPHHEAERRHARLRVRAALAEDADAVAAVEAAEQEGAEARLMARDGAPGRERVGPEVGTDGGQRGDELVAGAGQA